MQKVPTDRLLWRTVSEFFYLTIHSVHKRHMILGTSMGLFAYSDIIDRS
jgi:hypothetical protein